MIIFKAELTLAGITRQELCSGLGKAPEWDADTRLDLGQVYPKMDTPPLLWLGTSPPRRVFQSKLQNVPSGIHVTIKHQATVVTLVYPIF